VTGEKETGDKNRNKKGWEIVEEEAARNRRK